MVKADRFPFSASNTRRAVVLSAAYVALVIASAIIYAGALGGWELQPHYLMLLAGAGLCAWGLQTRRRWAWRLAVIFAAWQIYSGGRDFAIALRAGGMESPASAKVLLGLMVCRTLVLVALFLLLVLLTDREKLYKT